MPSTAVEPRSNMLAKMIASQFSKIKHVLPRHVTPERTFRIAVIEYDRVPELANCTIESAMGAILQSSQMGLEIGGTLGHAYMVPFKGKVQLIIGYRGMIDLARRSGQVLSIDAHVVYENDKFEYEYGTNGYLRHQPTIGDPGKPLLVYCCTKLRDGAFQFIVLPMRKVEEIRAASKAGNSGPWKTHYEEMARKTAVRALFKYLPISVEMQRAVSLDEMADAGISQGGEEMIKAEFSILDQSSPKQSAAAKVREAVSSSSLHRGGDEEIHPQPPLSDDSPPTIQDDWDLLEGEDLINAVELLVKTKTQREKFIKAQMGASWDDLRDFARSLK